MSSDKYLVTSVVRGRTQVKLWESAAPMGVGHPVRWVLERTSQGARIRTLDGQAEMIHLEHAAIDEGRTFSLPNSEIQVRVKRLRPIRAAYATYYTGPDSGDQSKFPLSLVVFSGVRRAVITSQQVHSAYVAYCQSKPMFTVQTDKDGMKITLLTNKISLKIKGQPPLSGAPGQIWKLSRENLARSTVTRGLYWWQFGLIAPSADLATNRRVEESDRFFKKALQIGFLCLGLAFIGSSLLQRSTPVARKEIPIEMPKDYGPVVIYRSSQGAPVAAGAPAGPIQASQETTSTTEAQAPQKARNPQKTRITRATLAKKTIHTAAKSQAETLKAALGGVANSVRNLVKPNAPSARPISGLFASNGSALSPTEVKPGYSGTDVKVGKVGGGGGHGASGSGAYGNGESVSVSGQGTSFASTDGGGEFVDQGLSKDQVGSVIHAHMSEIRYCHEAAMLATPGIEGKLVIDFSISPRGTVESQSVQSSTLLPDTSLQTCILRRLASWQFPKPRGKAHVAVSYPFLFKVLSREQK